MANDCCWSMKVVSRDKESVERMRKILDCEDGEFFLYRIFFDDCAESVHAEGDWWTAVYFGNVAWGAGAWICDAPDEERKSKTGAHYSSIPEICKSMGVGVEIWAEEIGNGQQEHYVVNGAGDVLVAEDMSGLESEESDDGFVCLKGGFDDFGKWASCDAIMEKTE